MKTRKPYTPTVAKRKLKKLIPITEKNVGKVMGQLNHFFSHPTLRLNGFSSKVIGHKIEEWNGQKFIFDIHSEEQYPYYIPYEAKCDLHYIWKEYLKGNTILFHRKEKDIPRLAISGKYTNGCIPISIGDSYKIYGNRLIIMHKWDKLIHHTPWMRFNEFIQVKSYDEEQLRKVRSSSCINEVIDGLYELKEGYEYKYSSFIGDYAHKISWELEKIFKHSYHREKVEAEINGLRDNFKMIVYPLKALDPNSKKIFMKFIDGEGNEYESCVKFVMDTVKKEMKEDYEKRKKQSRQEPIPDLDYDLDWDFNYEDL